jgi:hypothetical protein
MGGRNGVEWVAGMAWNTHPSPLDFIKNFFQTELLPTNLMGKA